MSDIPRFIETVKNASGTTAKTQLLRAMPEHMDKVLRYALDPYWNYNVSSVVRTGVGDMAIGEETFEILDNCRKGLLTGNSAREALTRHANELSSHDAEVLNMILAGKLRMGLGIKTLNKHLTNKIPVHATMLAQKMDLSKIRFPVWASPKLDGMRGQFVNGDRIVTRTGKPVIGVQHITNWLRQNWSHDLDGELMIPHLPFQKSLGQLRSHSDCPNAVFYVFDTQLLDKPFEERLELISKLKGRFDHIKIVTHRLVHNVDELMAFYQFCISKGLEGLVVKTRGHLYEETRSRHWMKMKEVGSVDVPIVGYEEGEGKYAGTLGALLVKLENGQINRVGTGFSDQERDEFWVNQKEYLFKVAEILYHEITLDGNLRHARFKCIRSDK